MQILSVVNARKGGKPNFNPNKGKEESDAHADMDENVGDTDGHVETCEEHEVIALSRCSTSDSLCSLSSAASSVTSGSRAKRFFCDYDGCNKSFTRPSLLTEHQQAVHQGVKPFNCHLCTRSFTKKSHLERHIISHSIDKPFHCSSCNKGFATRQQLKRHEITHTKSFKCPFPSCEDSFYKHPQLRAHILAVHEKKLTCKDCGKTFQRPYRLRNHIAKHHNPAVENPYQCTFPNCVRNFKIWSQLQAHIRNDHPKLRCTICDKPCVGSEGLEMHMSVHDDSLVARNWRCLICKDKSFAKKATLLDHYINIHPSEKFPKFLQDNSILAADAKLKEEEQEIDEEKRHDTKQSPKRRKVNEFASIRTEVKLESFFSDGIGGTDLILNSVGRKLKCPFSKCYRTFKTKERYEKHVEKHKIHLLKMKILQEETSTETFKDST